MVLYQSTRSTSSFSGEKWLNQMKRFSVNHRHCGRSFFLDSERAICTILSKTQTKRSYLGNRKNSFETYISMVVYLYGLWCIDHDNAHLHQFDSRTWDRIRWERNATMDNNIADQFLLFCTSHSTTESEHLQFVVSLVIIEFRFYPWQSFSHWFVKTRMKMTKAYTYTFVMILAENYATIGTIF